MKRAPTAKSNWTALISDLAEEDRKSVERCSESLSLKLRQCEGRLRSYNEGEEPVIKLLNETKEMRIVLSLFCKELVKRHKLPGLPV